MTEEQKIECTEEVLKVLQAHTKTPADCINVLAQTIVSISKVMDAEFTYENLGLLLTVENKNV